MNDLDVDILRLGRLHRCCVRFGTQSRIEAPASKSGEAWVAIGMGDAFTGDDGRRQGREGVDHEGGRIPSNPPNFLAWPPESSRATMPKSVGLPRVASCLKWTRAKCGRRSIWSRGKISQLKNQGSNKAPRKCSVTISLEPQLEPSSRHTIHVLKCGLPKGSSHFSPIHATQEKVLCN
jgi:hypothetical protein